MARSFVVVGLAYGDEGKGSWIDHLVRNHGIRHVVRFNGGVQANHNVVTPDGLTHGFAQLGAGTLVAGTQTLLTRFMLTDPEALLKEAQVLESKGAERVLDRVLISANAPIITPFNRLLNRIQEVSRGGSRHGSCGMGIGLTQQDVELLQERALYARDLASHSLFDKLAGLHDMKVSAAEQMRTPETAELIGQLKNADLDYYAGLYRHLANRLQIVSDEHLLELIRTNDTAFEGAQGVLLDQQYGFFPHCTRSNCTFANAELLLREAAMEGPVTRIGLLRGYSTRHGAGPFVTETPGLDIPPCHNERNLWQGQFRLGWFDAVSARYALKVVGGVDTLAITNLDRMTRLPEVKVATRYNTAAGPYFSADGELKVITSDITKLGTRCDALDSATPEYAVLGGWTDRLENRDRYLRFLEDELGHAIGAISESIDCRKIYR